jgi:hypothetical protein
LELSNEEKKLTRGEAEKKQYHGPAHSISTHFLYQTVDDQERQNWHGEKTTKVKCFGGNLVNKVKFTSGGIVVFFSLYSAETKMESATFTQ